MSRPRGFATLSEQRKREIAAMGGRASHERGTAHTFDTEQARAAGRKGGLAHSREHMRELGRKGGKARGEKLQQLQEGKTP